MGDKIRGGLAILVGVFGFFRSYQLFHQGMRGWTPWLMLIAGVILVLLGSLRIRRKPEDPAAELLK